MDGVTDIDLLPRFRFPLAGSSYSIALAFPFLPLRPRESISDAGVARAEDSVSLINLVATRRSFFSRVRSDNSWISSPSSKAWAIGLTCEIYVDHSNYIPLPMRRR